VPADAAKLVEKVVGFAQFQVSFGDLLELVDELGRQEGPAIFSEIPLFIGLGLEIVVFHPWLLRSL
jgi:hypothetical protein